jgi:hypothetical protein
MLPIFFFEGCNDGVTFASCQPSCLDRRDLSAPFIFLIFSAPAGLARDAPVDGAVFAAADVTGRSRRLIPYSLLGAARRKMALFIGTTWMLLFYG